MNQWWRASWIVNALLIGDPNCPFCATVNLFCADLAIGELGHRARIWREWSGPRPPSQCQPGV